ncbi:outer membrane protein assembly factor BamA [Parabacteroides sp. PH5-13]|uniref:translocation and assembly module lipoprotein TamL n=1 Tax=unclassified Parabacteroides TaxID=2649774 RepID=UPI002476D310|nr:MULTISPECIES: BamA/TamA family outer membrane protein [unclassified Parabacteroides]MDH6305331.1 outer membrane protein assembly factor BamA [Parabacteroides sp. PH5-39]MDH6320136.1 outer membrane protein assembly factor BamA [Parabacteroides sp. PH5-13]MDH6323921.1 outer membrane protein assembly factor BamA [Parabacteroides sp. PH5-8]MDH6385033.1 outer membrane protein assembly factor BamA [Parabacteroides sp. PH5-17]MDH6394333.1 outer membrane protein assembly factor BamA [Parabacteroide
MKLLFRLIFIALWVWVLSSCSSTKFVADGEYLLDKVIINTDNKQYKSTELKPYLRQQPNFKAFNLMKWQLFVYGWSGRDENKWINKQIRRIGEAPIILDTTLVGESVDELKRFLTNKGYPNAEITTSVDTTRNKKAVVTYDVISNQPYVIRDYAMKLDDPLIDSIAHLKPPVRSRLGAAFRSTPDEYIPVVKEGDNFDRDQLDKERQRITSLLRRRGYYGFNRDNLAYLADSTFNDNIVDLEMILKPHRKILPDGTIEEQPHRRYYLKDITILTDYDPLRLEDDEPFIPTDTLKKGDVTIVYGKNGRSIRPNILRRSNYMTPGSLFSERSLEQTYSSFASLNALRNVNIRFNEIEENDTMKLHATILTSPAKVHGFGVDIEGTNSAGDLGFASSLNYRHRNFFKGSEVFSAKIRGAYESLSGSKQYGLDNYWEIGGEMSLVFPRFLFPFISENFSRKLRANTEFKVSYNRQTRPEYERAVVSGGWSYSWQNRTNSLARHTFNLIDVDYLYLPRINRDFLTSLPEATQLYNFNNQFIVSSGYTYSFNNYNPQYRQRNTHSFRVSVESAGNVLNVLSHILQADKGNNGNYELFGIDYSQYMKGDFDFSKGIVLDNRNRLAFHLGVGLAYPYGNAKRIPFERRYFAGGANSVRGWSVRSLGPGSMSSDSATFATQAGDIRLDANLEYRTKLFWKFELAAFVDAGNIWTIRSYPDQEDGKFKFTQFYKEIAFSYGLGLRLDFDFFLIRFDTGFKAYDPQAKGSDRWAITHPNFHKNFAWHFAVGYPF